MKWSKNINIEEKLLIVMEKCMGKYLKSTWMGFLSLVFAFYVDKSLQKHISMYRQFSV